MWHLKSNGLEECVPVEEMGIETALISFPVAVSKYSDKKKLKGGRIYFSTRFESHSIIAESQGSGGLKQMIASIQNQKQAVMTAFSAHIPHLIQARIAIQGMTPPIIKMTLPTSINGVKKTPLKPI